MLRIVAYYKYEICILWKNQHRTFLWIHIGFRGFEVGEGVWGGREGGLAGYRFIKMLTFWFLSTKHTKTY